MESEHSYLFDEQVIAYSTQGRESSSYPRIIEAVTRAVKSAFKHKQAKATPAVQEASQPKADRIHETEDKGNATNADISHTESTADFMVALHSKFDTAKDAFECFSNEEGTIGKKEWRHIVKKMLPVISKADAKALRKQLPKKVSFTQFCELMDKAQPNKDKQKPANESTLSSHLAHLPGEVPVLPTSFKSRPHAHEQLVAALLDSSGNRSTAVTAPKSRVSSQGMGGVGKTMLTAAVVRDERVRGAFESIAWIGMSQQPELSQLQVQLYQQLHPQNEEMPKRANSVDSHLRELKAIAHSRIILICLDDVWDSSHEASFACIDIDTASRQLITTRIKGLLQGAAEVELELLGLQESVELLAGVACLDGAEISPACLEIAQLCGRLPLCLSIVGNLIRTFGAGWEQEVPAILRTDMRNLTDVGSGSSKEHTPLNMQARVIQSGSYNYENALIAADSELYCVGLDSISGADAEGVVSLFKAMAVVRVVSLVLIFN
jgi:hypothetical protein